MTSFEYDKADRLVWEVNAQGVETVYEYDGSSNRLSESVSGKVTSFFS